MADLAAILLMIIALGILRWEILNELEFVILPSFVCLCCAALLCHWPATAVIVFGAASFIMSIDLRSRRELSSHHLYGGVICIALGVIFALK
ncbi:MAG: hypothetical protein A2X49_14165 [Lentisphaerae bacterium GWF2_52_8]|nr:MAG: hypothetical protein A2X49_14165 [Lentisphaerae bacterium GWF2_52_8]